MATDDLLNKAPAARERPPFIGRCARSDCGTASSVNQRFYAVRRCRVGWAEPGRLLTCGLIAIAVAIKNRMPWDVLRTAALEGVASGLGAIFILLAVGALIGTWAMRGTIVAMVY